MVLEELVVTCTSKFIVPPYSYIIAMSMLKDSRAGMIFVHVCWTEPVIPLLPTI